MKRILLSAFFLSFILSAVGCRVDLEVWVNNNGSGNGTMLISGVPMFDKNDFKSRLAQKGIECLSLTDVGIGAYESKIKWTDFDRAFGRRIENGDGSVYLDFGKIELGSVTVHVDGQINRERTGGAIVDNSSVRFTSGAANLVYTPNKAPSFQPVIFIIIGIAVVVFLLSFYLFKRRGKAT